MATAATWFLSEEEGRHDDDYSEHDRRGENHDEEPGARRAAGSRRLLGHRGKAADAVPCVLRRPVECHEPNPTGSIT